MAAAHAAIGAAQLVRARPSASPRQLRVALDAGRRPAPAGPRRRGRARARARPRGGDRRPHPARGQRRPLPAPDRLRAHRAREPGRGARPARARARSGSRHRGALGAPGVRIPPGGAREAEIDIGAGAAGVASGRLVARDQAGATVVSQPFALPTAPPAPVPAGPLALERRRGRVTGVHFPLGAFERGDPLRGGSALSLTRAAGSRARARRRGNRLVRRLTPPGGARELLPAEYAYALPAGDAARPRARPLRVPRARPLAAGGRQADGRPLGRVPAMRTVTLYGRPDCHLCDDARAALLRVRAHASLPPRGTSTSRPTTRFSPATWSESPSSRSTARSCSTSSSTRRQLRRKL